MTHASSALALVVHGRNRGLGAAAVLIEQRHEPLDLLRRVAEQIGVDLDTLLRVLLLPSCFAGASCVQACAGSASASAKHAMRAMKCMETSKETSTTGRGRRDR